jgi:uncharacterized membrane protein
VPSSPQAPTVPPLEPGNLNRALARNIEALRERQIRDAERAPAPQRVADAITRFTGSMSFVFLHLLLFGFWIAANLGWVERVAPWDPSFVILAMAASVEAIFLSTFVLISQNRMAAESERRANLDLQINLLAEHEVTRLISLVSAIADRLGVEYLSPEEIGELRRDVAPETVLDAIEREDRGR